MPLHIHLVMYLYVLQAVNGWGEVLRAWYNKDAGRAQKDLTVTHLGYYTDNGTCTDTNKGTRACRLGPFCIALVPVCIRLVPVYIRLVTVLDWSSFVLH